MRTKKPWVRARRILDGWYVRFILKSLQVQLGEISVLALRAHELGQTSAAYP
jgi:hypothetical protein